MSCDSAMAICVGSAGVVAAVADQSASGGGAAFALASVPLRCGRRITGTSVPALDRSSAAVPLNMGVGPEAFAGAGCSGGGA